MGLFKPKAPKTPEGAAYQFHFAGDNRNPDGSYRQTAADLQINAAVERVKLELARLRASIAGATGVATMTDLNRAIAEAYATNAAASASLELKRRQFAGGIATTAEVTLAAREYDARRKRLQALHTDRQKREQADNAAIELDSILTALR